jgi:hypothetical protein
MFHPKEETIWMDKDQIGLLFGRDRTVISRHIKNLFSDHELDKIKFVQKMHELEESTSCAKNARQINEQIHYVTFYNLDVIISIGHRVKSTNGVVFRKWANNVLREFLLKGYNK